MQRSRAELIRLACMSVVALFVMSAMFGGIGNTPGANAARPDALISSQQGGNVTVGTGYSLTSWNLSGGTQVMQGNLTIREGGVVRLSNETMMFDEFASSGTYPGASIFHITVEDGGRLIMSHSTVTTNLQLLNDIPVLGVFESNGASILMQDNSSFVFPGQFVVYSSNFTMIDSSISGFSASQFNPNYINESVFPPNVFANPPVSSFYSANVLLQNSKIYMYSLHGPYNQTTVFVEHYPFASDSAQKNSVSYSLEAIPTSVFRQAPLADTTTNQNIFNLTAFDQSNYVVQAGQRLSVTNFTTGGLNEPLSAVTLNVEYETSGATSGTPATIDWAYGNTTDHVQQASLINTASYYAPNANNYYTSSITLPGGLTENDLSRIIVWINVSSGTLLVNKLWFLMTISQPAYKNMTIGGASSFTAIDSFIDANFIDSGALHDAISVADTAHAYLYGVTVNQSVTSGYTGPFVPAIVGQIASMTAKAATFGPSNTASPAELNLLDSNTSTYYNITAGSVMQTYGMNVSGGVSLNTQLKSATLYLWTDTASSSNVYIGQIGESPTNYVSTKISLGSTGTGQYSANLYSLGITTMTELNNLVVYINNPAGSGTISIKDLRVQAQILPQAYIYRFADVTVHNGQGLPVNNSRLSFKYSSSTPTNVSAGTSAGYYVAPLNNYQMTPPSSVLSYLGKTSSNYNVTNYFGNAVVPLLTDLIDYSTYPDSMFVGNYTMTVIYNGADFGFSMAFEPFPNITAASQLVYFNVSIPVTVPLPLVLVGKPYVTPSFVYQNQTGQITFNITDDAQTGINSITINVSDGANGQLVSSENVVTSLSPLETKTITLPWTFSAAGNNSISVNANPNKTVPESSYSGDFNSTLFYVEPNLPELVVSSSGITFNPSPAFSGKAVVITATIQNTLGRAGVKNLTVGFYYGNPLSGGTLIGTGITSVSAGGTNTTSISWIPTTIGSVPIYVYIDPSQTIVQYSHAGNLNYSVLLIYLSVGQQDLVINDSNSGPSQPFQIISSINMSSNIVVTQSGYLMVSNGGINFIESYSGEYAFLVNQTGRTVIENSLITSNYLVNLYVFGSAQLVLINSVLGPNINVVTGGSAAVWINNSAVQGSLVTAAFSGAVINSFNSVFSNPISLGYSEVANLYNISAPSVSAQSGAAAYIYRWLTVDVYGQSGTTIGGALVSVYTFANLTEPHGTLFSQGYSNSTGAVVFAGLSDIINSHGDTYRGDYVVNTSYVNAGTWYAPNETISLAHYSIPLIQQNSMLRTVLFIKLPDLEISSQNIFVTPSLVVEESTVNITALVYNIGYAAVTQNFTVEFGISGNNYNTVIDQTAVASVSQPLSVSSSIPLPVIAEWAVPQLSGNVTVTVNVNPANATGVRAVSEISYTNNIAQTTVDVYSLPYLSPTSMTASGPLQEETNVTFNVTVRNTGQLPADNVPLTILEGPSVGNITTAVANTTIPVIAADSSLNVAVVWTAPALPSGVKQETMLFLAVVNPNETIKETSYTQDILSAPLSINITIAKVNAAVLISSSSVKAGTYIVLTVTVTSQVTHKPMKSFPVNIELYNIRGQPQSSTTFSGTTNSNGVMIARIFLPASQTQGAYHFEVFSGGQFVSSSQSFNVISPQTSTGIPLLYWLLIGIVIIAGFVGVSLYLYRYGLARVVECGNCGAFIPETSKKCSYCGVEFETGTAKCSNCNSWIPANSKDCPICGVRFVDEGVADKEDDTNAEMRKGYMEFTDKFKAQARAEMGGKYSDKAFLSWWKKQPTYLSFEDWLARQQEMKKAKMIQCPSCGEMNPENSIECMKCGTVLKPAKGETPKEKPPETPPPQNIEGKAPPQEPRRIVVPKRIIRKIEDRPQDKPQQQESQQTDGSAGGDQQSSGGGSQ